MSPQLTILIDRALLILRKLFRSKQTITFGRLELCLPDNHLLPVYLKKYPAYDRFLPTLGALLPPDSVVIDVGANVGDTAISMYARNSRLNFLCVEPSQVFYRFLEMNLRQLDSSNVCTFNEAISNQSTGFKLSATNGTAKIEYRSGKDERHTRALDDLISSMPSHFKEANINLLKSDTDGQDSSVILSSAKTIRAHKPIIFMECQVNNVESIKGYLESFSFLKEAGYTEWHIFSNLGVFVKRVTDFISLENILTENLEVSLKTGFPRYFDLLVATNLHSDIVYEAIRQHSQITVL